jgi:hypothetical protein
LSEALAGDGAAIFRHGCAMGLEGIVSKRIGSRYVSGRTRAWLKVKTRGSMTAGFRSYPLPFGTSARMQTRVNVHLNQETRDNLTDYDGEVAEGVGFEPTMGLHPWRFSRPLP